MLKIAHRGYSSKYGDNNITSFQQAIYNRFDMIELDIQMCKDGEIIVYHDPVIENKWINNTTLKELKELGVITLRDFFCEISPDVIKIFLDIKNNDGICEPLLQMINQMFTESQQSNIYISSFYRDVIIHLNDIREKNNFKLGFTTSNRLTIDELDYMMNGLQYICLDWTVLSEEQVDYLKSKGYTVFVFTCKNNTILEYIKRYNIDGIVSDILI